MNKNLQLRFSNLENSIVSNSIGKELSENPNQYGSVVTKRLNEIFDKSERNRLDELIIGDYDLIKEVVSKFKTSCNGVEVGVPSRIKERLFSKIQKNIQLNSGDFHLIEDELFELIISDNEYKFIDKFLEHILNEGDYIDYVGIDDIDINEILELKSKLLEGFRMYERVYQVTLREINILIILLLNDIDNFQRILHQLYGIYTQIQEYRINDLYPETELF